jgi:hypothetical protein
VFILGLFNDALKISDYIEWNERMISELESMWKERAHSVFLSVEANL